MTLADYLTHHDLTYAELARRLGTSRQQAERWAKGQRIPRRDEMLRIVELTDRAVMPNDFYGLSAEAA